MRNYLVVDLVSTKNLSGFINMEGKYTKAGTIIALISLIIAAISFVPKSSNNLTGEWLMTSKITKADMKAYIGAEVQWKMYITESDNKIQGTAEKIKINGIDVDYNQRTSLEFNGVIEKNKLTINYVENGKVRKTSGIIKSIFQDDSFFGNFSQTASSTNGTIIGCKIN